MPLNKNTFKGALENFLKWNVIHISMENTGSQIFLGCIIILFVVFIYFFFLGGGGVDKSPRLSPVVWVHTIEKWRWVYNKNIQQNIHIR